MEIRAFQQRTNEILVEAREIFKGLIRMCPSHGLEKGNLVQNFNRRLDHSSRYTLDSSSGGASLYKTLNQGYQLLEDLTIHNLEWMFEKKSTQKRAFINAVDHESTKDVASLRHN